MQLGLPKTFYPFPQGSHQFMTDSCEGQEIVALAQGKADSEKHFQLQGSQREEAGQTSSESISAHLFSCLGSLSLVLYKLCQRQVPQSQSSIRILRLSCQGTQNGLGDNSRSNEGRVQESCTGRVRLRLAWQGLF